MLEIKKQLTTVDAQSTVSTVSTKSADIGVKRRSKNPLRPKIKRRAVVDGKPKLGRPKKSDIEKKKKPGLIGRPPGSGDGARIAEFKARLLATAGDSVITKIIQTALEDGHPAQGAMLKFCGERLLPLSSFEAKSSGGAPQISINITGLHSSIETTEVIDNDITDVVIKDIDDNS